MAVFKIDYFSRAIRRSIPLTVLLPIERTLESAADAPFSPFRTLYLLHGYSGTHTDWLENSRIAQLSQQYRLAVVMPSTENSFCLDDTVRGALYEKMVADELMTFSRSVFPLSKERSDTAIGGLSMGGYGALHTGLKYPDSYGAIIALSSALITDQVAHMTEENVPEIAPFSYYRHTFGEPANVLGSDVDPKALAQKLANSPEKMPRLYMACGTEDFLIENNRSMHEHLTKLGLSHEYREGAGVHDWAYWDAHIAQALEWLYGKPE